MTPRALIAPARLAGQSLLRTQTDERLVDLVRAGNDGAFEALVTRYRRQLLRYCEGILSGPRAEDAVQQVFVRAYDALRESEGPMNVKPWLYRIAHNTALNGLRDRALGDSALDPRSPGGDTPDRAFERSEELREVLAAVQGLPERQRDAIVLRELEGRSYAEIGTALGVTGGSVRMLLTRARTTVRTGMTALTPFALLTRIPDGVHESTTARIGELVGFGGSAALAKVGATVLVTGAVVGGGVAVESNNQPESASASGNTAAAEHRSSGDGPGPSTSGSRGGLPAAGVAARDDRRRGNGGNDSGKEPSRTGSGRDDSSRSGSDKGPGGSGKENDDSGKAPDNSGEGPAGEDHPAGSGGPGGDRAGGSDDSPSSGSGHSGSTEPDDSSGPGSDATRSRDDSGSSDGSGKSLADDVLD